MPDDIFDIDITNLSDQFSTIENDINKIKSGFSGLSSDAQAKITKMVKAAKAYSKSIDSIDDAYKNLGRSGEASIEKLIDHLLKITQSVEETKAIMEKMGISGRFISESVDKASKSMLGFFSAIGKARWQMHGMVGILGSGTVAAIAYGGALGEITKVMAKYQKEIYNAVRASQILGQSHKSAIAGLRGMAAATGLNEQAAAKFYQTYLSVSNGIAPTTGKMVAFVKSIGDEFGNTEEDINRFSQQFGKLQSLQIGINLDYLDDLKNGLIDSYDVATKLAKMRILGVDRSTIESFLRLKDSANVKEETKSLKNMSDLVAHLDSVINRFVAQNGDKLKELINSFAKIGQIVVTIFSKIPAPLLETVVTLKLMHTLVSGLVVPFGNLSSKFAGLGKGTKSLAESSLKMKASKAAAGAVSTAPFYYSTISPDVKRSLANRALKIKTSKVATSVATASPFHVGTFSPDFLRSFSNKRNPSVNSSIGTNILPYANFGTVTPDVKKAFEDKVKKRDETLRLKNIVSRAGSGAAVPAEASAAVKAEKNIGVLGKMSLKLEGIIGKLTSSFSVILVGAAAMAAAFFAASKAIKLIFGKKVSGANEALEASKKAQLAGNENKAKGEAAKIAKISKKSSMISGSVVGGAVVGAGAGVGVAALAALAGVAVVALPLAAGLGAVAGVVGGVISASKESAKITKANNVAIMNEQSLKGRLNSLNKQEIAAIQKKNEVTFDEIKAAKYGSGTWGNILELFDKQMPNVAGGFKAISDWASDLASNVGPAVSSALSSLGDGFSYLDSILPSWLGKGRSAGDNPYKFEMKVNKDVNTEDATIRKLKLKIKTINSTMESSSLNPEAIGALKTDKKNAEKEMKAAMVRRNMMHSMITNPKYSRQKKEYQEKSGSSSKKEILNSNSDGMKKLREDAKAAANSDAKKFMTDASINRVMDAVLTKYENQKKIIDEMLSATQELYGLFLKSSNPKLAGESINEIIKFQDALVKVSTEASQKMDNLVKSLSGDGDMKKRKEKFSKEIKDIDLQIKLLGKKNDVSSKYQRKYLNGLKEQLKTLKDKNNIEEQNEGVKVLSAKTDKENSKNTLQRIEGQRLIGTQLDRQKSLLKSDLDLGRQRLDLTKSFMGGIGLTYEMQMEQLGKVRKMQDIVAKQVALNQTELKKQTKERREAEEKYQKLLGSGVDEKKAAIRSGLVKARGKEEETLLNLNKYKMEGLQLAQEEVNLTKELRYGYLSAMQSQAMAAGTFSKILFTRDQHLTKMLDKRTNRMKALSQSTPGYNSYVGPLGGRYNEKQVTYARKQYAGGFAQHTTTGFKGGEELRNISFPWYSKNVQKTAEEIVGRTGSTGAAAVSGGVAYGSGAIMDVQQRGVVLANSMDDQIITIDKVVKATNHLAEAIDSTANILKSNEQRIAEETANRKKIEGQIQKDRPRASVDRGVKYNGNTEINSLRKPVSNKKAVGGIIPSFSSGGVLPLEEGVISGHTGVTGRDSALRRASGGFFITRRSESRKPHKAKVLDSINAGRYNSGGSNLSPSGEVVNVMPEETVTSSKRFEKNPMVLSLLGAINDPKVSDDKFRGFARGGADGTSVSANFFVPNAKSLYGGVSNLGKFGIGLAGFVGGDVAELLKLLPVYNRKNTSRLEEISRKARGIGAEPFLDIAEVLQAYSHYHQEGKEHIKNQKIIKRLKIESHFQKAINNALRLYPIRIKGNKIKLASRIKHIEAIYSRSELLGPEKANRIADYYRKKYKIQKKAKIDAANKNEDEAQASGKKRDKTSSGDKKKDKFFDHFAKLRIYGNNKISGLIKNPNILTNLERNKYFTKKYSKEYMESQRARYKNEYASMTVDLEKRYKSENNTKKKKYIKKWIEIANNKGKKAQFLLNSWLNSKYRRRLVKNRSKRSGSFYKNASRALAYMNEKGENNKEITEAKKVFFGSDDAKAIELYNKTVNEYLKNRTNSGLNKKKDTQNNKKKDKFFDHFAKLRIYGNNKISGLIKNPDTLTNLERNKYFTKKYSKEYMESQRARYKNEYKNMMEYLKKYIKDKNHKKNKIELAKKVIKGIEKKDIEAMLAFNRFIEFRENNKLFVDKRNAEFYNKAAKFLVYMKKNHHNQEDIDKAKRIFFGKDGKKAIDLLGTVYSIKEMNSSGIIGSSGLISSYASEGFPGQPKGIDTERYMLSAGDVVLNREATNIYRDIHGRVPGKMVAPSGGKVNSIASGNQPFFVASGEAIIPAKEARSIGYGALTDMNDLGNSKKTKAGRMASGGIVGNIDNKIGKEREEIIAKSVAQMIASQNIVGGFVPSKNSQSGVGGSVSVGGITIGYHHNDNKGKEENDEALVQNVVEKVEQELREALIKEQKQRVI